MISQSESGEGQTQERLGRMVSMCFAQWFSQSPRGDYFHPREYRARTQRVTHSTPVRDREEGRGADNGQIQGEEGAIQRVTRCLQREGERDSPKKNLATEQKEAEEVGRLAKLSARPDPVPRGRSWCGHGGENRDPGRSVSWRRWGRAARSTELSLDGQRHSPSQAWGQWKKMGAEVNIWGCREREKGYFHHMAFVLETCNERVTAVGVGDGERRHYGKFGDEKFLRDCWGTLAPESVRGEKGEATPRGCVTLPMMVGNVHRGRCVGFGGWRLPEG